MAKKGTLNDKQIIFAEEYLVDYNATQAGIRAGYSPKTAYAQAHKLLKNAQIQKYIEERREEIAKKSEYTLQTHLESNKKMIDAYHLALELALRDDLTIEEEIKFNRLFNIIKASDANKAKDITNRMMGWEKKEIDINIHTEQPLFGDDEDND